MSIRVSVLPAWAPMDGTTFGCTDRIWVKAGASPGMIAHETKHCEQAIRDTPWVFRVRYVFSPAWRVKYEAEAYAEQVKRGSSIDRCAEAIASWMYLKPCSVEDARAAISEFLKEEGHA